MVELKFKDSKETLNVTWQTVVRDNLFEVSQECSVCIDARFNIEDWYKREELSSLGRPLESRYYHRHEPVDILLLVGRVDDTDYPRQMSRLFNGLAEENVPGCF